MEQFRIILTKKDNRILYGYYNEDVPVELYAAAPGHREWVDSIYVARVEKTVQGISGAFLSIGNGEQVFFPYRHNRVPKRFNVTKHEELRPGDMILVQITKEGAGQKLPAVTDRISLQGTYVVLTVMDERISISKKISDPERRRALESLLSSYANKEFGLIARTNAQHCPDELLKAEILSLIAEYESLMTSAAIAPGGRLLSSPKPHYLSVIKEYPMDTLKDIVTDDEDMYEELKGCYDAEHYPLIHQKIRLYRDSYPLEKLYRLEHHYQCALSRTVLLKSGGSLIIDKTEAMTVIDVNSGAVPGKKKQESLIFSMNKEAAHEIARQLRIRNLSGIILIDFINMTSKEHQEELLRQLRTFCKEDRITCHVIDMTALGLVEMTRDRSLLPLSTQWSETGQKE